MRFLFVFLLVGVAFCYVGKDVFWKNASAPDFMGIWRAEDGAMIELKNDGSCRVIKMDFGKLVHWECYEGKKVSLTGRWNYNDFFMQERQTVNENKILLELSDPRSEKVKYSLVLMNRRNFLWKKEIPSTIYTNMLGKEKYEFKRWTAR